MSSILCSSQLPSSRQLTRARSTPQAFPGGTSSSLQNLSSSYAAFVTDHFLPSVPVLRITDKKAFVPTLHLTVLGADGSVPMALVLAARAAFCDLAVPKTKVIGWEGAEDDARAGKDMAGIKGAVGAARGKGRARARGADDWDLEDGSTEHMANRDTLPVLVTLHLVPESDAFFVDAAPKEEEACSGKIHAMFRPDGRICGLRTEGDAGIDASRIRPLLQVSVPTRKLEPPCSYRHTARFVDSLANVSQEAKAIALDLAASLNTDLP